MQHFFLADFALRFVYYKFSIKRWLKSTDDDVIVYVQILWYLLSKNSNKQSSVFNMNIDRIYL